jgi:hypothetical protein
MVDVTIDGEPAGIGGRHKGSHFGNWVRVDPRTFATLAHVVTTGARVEFTTGK